MTREQIITAKLKKTIKSLRRSYKYNNFMLAIDLDFYPMRVNNISIRGFAW